MISDVFACHEAKLHTLPGAPSKRTANHTQLVAHHKHLKILNADKIQPRFGTDPDDENGFFESACHSILAREDIWRQCGLIFAWVDQTPTWVSPVHWDLDILPDPKVATQRCFRFSLLGGGQIRVLEKLELMDGLDGTICYEPKIKVTADAGEGLRHFTGVIERVCCEMVAAAVLFLPNTPQSIAERTAATLRLLDPGTHPTTRGPDPDRFAALLTRGTRCCVCRRPLRDHVSNLLGIGPDCAKQMQLPHNLEAANRILRLRKEILGADADGE